MKRSPLEDYGAIIARLRASYESCLFESKKWAMIRNYSLGAFVAANVLEFAASTTTHEFITKVGSYVLGATGGGALVAEQIKHKERHEAASVIDQIHDVSNDYNIVPPEWALALRNGNRGFSSMESDENFA